MPYWSGRTGPCWWSYFSGRLTPADWNEFLAFSRCSYLEGCPGDVILTIPFDAAPPDASMRGALTQLIEQTREDNRITHHAFVTPSRRLFLINTAVNWVVTKPYMEKTFSDPVEALTWLERMNPSSSAHDMMSAISNSVPEDACWDALVPSSSGKPKRSGC